MSKDQYCLSVYLQVNTVLFINTQINLIKLRYLITFDENLYVS